MYHSVATVEKLHSETHTVSRIPARLSGSTVAPTQPRELWLTCAASIDCPSAAMNTAIVSGRCFAGRVASAIKARVVCIWPARSRRSHTSPMRIFSPGAQPSLDRGPGVAPHGRCRLCYVGQLLSNSYRRNSVGRDDERCQAGR